MHGEIQRNLNTASFIVDTLELCRIFSQARGKLFLSFLAHWVESSIPYVEHLYKDTSTLDTIHPYDRY